MCGHGTKTTVVFLPADGEASQLLLPSSVSLLSVGMSSLFINLVLRTPHYLQMKVLNERISKWAHLSFYHKQFLRYLHLKFKKEVIFFRKIFPL